eukprot:5469230-Amphidinium_carterae.1
MSPPRGVLLQQLRLQPSRAPIPTRDVSPQGCVTSAVASQAARQSQLGMSPPRGVLLQQLHLKAAAPVPAWDASPQGCVTSAVASPSSASPNMGCLPPGVCYFSSCDSKQRQSQQGMSPPQEVCTFSSCISKQRQFPKLRAQLKMQNH